jgi:hypothetical protein
MIAVCQPHNTEQPHLGLACRFRLAPQGEGSACGLGRLDAKERKAVD